MPGHLIPGFLRHTPPHSVASSPSSSTASVNEIPSRPGSASFTSKPTFPNIHTDRDRSPDRRLPAAVDQLIHPHRDRSKEKRRSLGRYSRSKDRTSKEESRAASAKLEVIVESRPLVCYGSPSSSTGALFSGRLKVSVADPAGAVTLDKLDMRLVSKTTTKKPVSRDCPSCASRTDELTSWNLLTTESLSLKNGDHDFPFTYLFPGNTPASCDGALGRIEYFLTARAHSANGEEFPLTMPVYIKRAILPGIDKSSVRIFPPTNLTGRVVLPSVVHPIGTFPVQMTLSGVVDAGEESQTRWRLRKMMWRIEEHQKIVSTACQKHAHKIGGEGKGVLHQETRVIGHNEEKGGWKTDFDTAGGEISMEFEANINPTSMPVCDLETPTGLESKHNLVIELIVAEESGNQNTRSVQPTGAARVLRMQFHLHVTERSGLGISWDKEMPPMYEDVPASPPGYAMLDGASTMEDYRGSPLPLPDYENLDRIETLRLDSDSTHSSRGRARFTEDDLTAEPAGLGADHRRASGASHTSN